MSDAFGEAASTAIDHAGADAAAGLGAGGQGQRRGAPGGVCENCGTVLAGDFCQDCGQSGQSLRRPFWTLLGEGIETLFAVDGRIARTVPVLLFYPGRMTRAYLEGQRTRFIPPFRLYVIASLLFFVALPLVMGQGIGFTPPGTDNFDDARAEIEQALATGAMTQEEYDTALNGIDAAEQLWRAGLPGLVQPPPESSAAEVSVPGPEGESAGFMPETAVDALRQAGAEGDPAAARFARAMDNPGKLSAETQRWIPRLMFVLLPVYACLLALVYLWRQQFLFFDHLIVSLHFHSALFFAMTLGVAASMLMGAGWVWLALIVYSNWYLYRVHRLVYERGRTSSILRVLTLDTLYATILIIALLAAVILGALSV